MDEHRWIYTWINRWFLSSNLSGSWSCDNHAWSHFPHERGVHTNLHFKNDKFFFPSSPPTAHAKYHYFHHKRVLPASFWQLLAGSDYARLRAKQAGWLAPPWSSYLPGCTWSVGFPAYRGSQRGWLVPSAWTAMHQNTLCVSWGVCLCARTIQIAETGN